MDNQQYPNNNQQQAPQQPQYQAPQYNQPPMYPQGPVEQPGKNLAIGALVCGIASLVVPYVGLIAAIVGLVLSINAKKRGFVGGINTAGLVLSIIGLVCGFIMIVFTACSACLFVSNPYWFIN